MIHVHAKTYDPTRTTELRNSFAKELARRFDRLTKTITEAIITQDCFGLKAKVVVFELPRVRQFNFPRSGEKVAAFMKWLQEQVDAGVLEVRDIEQIGTSVNSAWTNKYLFESYKRGVMRSRYEMKKAGLNVPNIEETGGINISMSTPMHLDRLGLIYTRTYTELKGITDAMGSQVSRVLSQGIADGDNPVILARKMRAIIGGLDSNQLGIVDSLGRFIPARRRAEILARTEIIRAHHVATVQEYKNWEVAGVRVSAELRTGGDDRVCEECLKLEKDDKGNFIEYSLDEIEKLIPVHPQCRCIALPLSKSESKNK